jgi:hypothetical protein
VGPGYYNAVGDDSPELFWEMEDSSGTTIADASVNSRTGTTHGSPTLAQASPVLTEPTSKSILFDGVDDYISSGYAPFAAGSSRTFEILFNRANHTDHHVVFSSTNGAVYLHLDSDGDLVAFFPSEDSAPTVWDGVIPGDNQWVHLALTVNDSGHTARLYLNAVDKGQNTGIASYKNNTNVNVGVRGTTTNWFPGNLTCFAVYSSILSAARIQAHYDALT